MFQLNENSMKRILREEYFKRLKEFLAEEIDIEYGKGVDKINLINNAQGLKVRHDETGLEYTILKYDEAAGNVVLLLPDESRLNQPLMSSTSKLVEVEGDIDNDGIPDIMDKNVERINQLLDTTDEQKAQRKTTKDKLNLLNFDKKDQKNDNKKYMIVPVDEFIKKYSL